MLLMRWTFRKNLVNASIEVIRPPADIQSFQHHSAGPRTETFRMPAVYGGSTGTGRKMFWNFCYCDNCFCKKVEIRHLLAGTRYEGCDCYCVAVVKPCCI